MCFEGNVLVLFSLWQDAENRLHLAEEFERRNSKVVVILDFY